MLVPLNDLQEELGGLEEANVFQSQLQSGQVEKPSILSSLQNSGTIDVTLEKDEADNNKMSTTLYETHQFTVYSDTKRHQEAQTELRLNLISDALVHGLKTESEFASAAI